MTPDRLAELKALGERATDGPWMNWSEEGPLRGPNGEFFESQTASVCRGDMRNMDWDEEHHVCVAKMIGKDEDAALDNARFVAAARSAVPELIAEVESMPERIATYLEQFDRIGLYGINVQNAARQLIGAIREGKWKE